MVDLCLLFRCIISLGIAVTHHLFGTFLTLVEQLRQLFIILFRPFAVTVIPLDFTTVKGILEGGNNRLHTAPIIIPYIRIQRGIAILGLRNIHTVRLTVSDLSGYHNKAEVIKVITAGGKGNNRVMLIDIDGAINKGTHPQFIDIIQEIIITAEAASEIIENFALPFQGIGLENSNDLPLTLFIEGIISKDRCLFIEFQILKIHQIGKHSAVLHMMTMQKHIFAVKGTAVIQENGTIFGIVAIEITIEIIRVFPIGNRLGILGGLHNNIINDGIRHSDPAYCITVRGEQLGKI